ncbi:amidohydrolase family protein [Ascidiaceihabitans sp.]|uniref:amidohydrolase family protein n=1 Tax=Ascidiaceihabitans sp. TaxID=1872644 RepID=UPI003298F667
MDKPDAQMPPRPTAPKIPLPKGACDAHVHLVAGRDDFTLWEGRVENPAPGPNFNQWLSLYQQHLDTMGFERGVIVHSILYGTDNSVTVEAVRRMGNNFKGVGLLPDGATETQIGQFAEWNMCAVRLNYVHGGVLTWDGAKAMAPALAERGLHIQMLCHADQHMDALAADIKSLPVPVVFDHITWPTQGLAANGKGIDTLCALLDSGKIWIKLSALYRMCDAPFDAAAKLVERLIKTNPDRCLWGSDWPHLMLNGADMPNGANLLDALDNVASTQDRQKIFVDNPNALFKFAD